LRLTLGKLNDDASVEHAAEYIIEAIHSEQKRLSRA
jgi:hypothetical protein